jgi:hypothetical protein
VLPSDSTTIPGPPEPRAIDPASLRLLTRSLAAPSPRPRRPRVAALARPAAAGTLVAGAALVPARPALGLALLAGGGFLWVALHDPTTPTLRRIASPRPGRWYAGARRDLDSVGAGAHQRELARVRDKHGALGLVATLVPDRDRRSGRYRVRVDLHGYVVGWLSEGAAEAYRERMGAEPAAVPVSLVGFDPIELIL